jgi:hypothetical protein
MSSLTRAVLLLLAFATICIADDSQWKVYYPANPNVIANGVATTAFAASTLTASATAATTTQTVAAYLTSELAAPALPSPLPATQFPVQLLSGGMTNLSIPQPGSFMGFSIEMSVSTQICEYCFLSAFSIL